MARKFKRYNNGVENIIVYEGDPVPEGYVRGMLVSEDVKKARLEKAKQTFLEKYGVENPMQSKEVVDKLKNSNMIKYGVTCSVHAESVKEKVKQTNIERYGVENYFQSNDFKEKYKNSMQEKYGVDNSFQAKEVKAKIRETNLKNLGVEYPMQSEEVREKSKQTSLELYGTEYPNQSEEVKAKIEDSLISHYGVKRPMQSEEIKQKVVQTNLEKYGTKCYTQSDEYLEKAPKTNLEKYGVPWACMRIEAKQGYSNDSKPNKEFENMLKVAKIKFIREFPLGSYSYDFKAGNTLIEINPSATHNSLWNPFGREGLSKDYHLNKSLTAEKYGYHCIHIFDWDNIVKIVDLLKPRERVYARKCSVQEISQEEINVFLNKYHLQGSCRGQIIKIGLYYNNELVSVMSFGKPRYNNNYQYELLRYASSRNVIGGADKIFKHFVETYNPESIISYCDLSKFSGKVYSNVGFNLKLKREPSKHWYSVKENMHITNNLLIQRGYDQLFNESYGKGTSNEELMIQRGFVSIYDCGQAVYEWKGLQKDE